VLINLNKKYQQPKRRAKDESGKDFSLKSEIHDFFSQNSTRSKFSIISS
jgi:hypothetical protein